jgi:DNA polymerase I-like protein with 3'-5' exonuclease and polymerase domains
VADILWCVLNDVASRASALGGRLVTTVHDSILIEVPEQSVTVALADIKQIMERKFDCVRKDFFIPVSTEVGKPGASWADVH